MLRRLRDRLLQHRLLRRVVLLATGAAAGQVLIVLVTPILSRLFTPEEFGWFASFTGLMGFVGMAACWRYDAAVPLARSTADAAHTVILAVALACVTALLVAIGLVWLGPWLAARMMLPNAGTLLYWLVPGIILVGVSLAFDGWSMQRGDVRAMVVSKFGQGLGIALLQLSFGLLGWGESGLIAGYVLGYVVAAAAIGWRLPGEAWRSLARAEPQRVVALARSHWRFAVLSTPATLLNGASRLLPPLLVALTFGPALAGLYGLAQRVVGLPIRFIGISVGQVYTSEINRLGADAAPDLLRMFRRTTLIFVALGLLFLAPLAALGPELFALVFGERWRLSGEIVLWLAPMYLLTFVRMPTRHALYICNRHDVHLWLAAAAALIKAGLRDGVSHDSRLQHRLRGRQSGLSRHRRPRARCARTFVHCQSGIICFQDRLGCVGNVATRQCTWTNGERASGLGG